MMKIRDVLLEKDVVDLHEEHSLKTKHLLAVSCGCQGLASDGRDWLLVRIFQSKGNVSKLAAL